MPWIGGLIAGGIGLLGSSMQADAAQGAAQQSADAQVRAAQIAAEEARFRPVGVTTAFGSSRFGFDPQGRLTSAGYTLSPQLQAIRDRLLSQAGEQGLDTAERGFEAGTGLFNLGQRYLAESPEAAAQRWMQSQQDLLAPSRERVLSGVRQKLLNTGRTGLSVGATGMRPGGGMGLAAANPELEAYYNALAQQDAQLAAQAMEQGQNQVRFGSGLLSGGLGLQSSAYTPFQTQLGLGGTVESLGQGAFDLGTGLGARVQTGSNAAAQSLLAGGLGAAQTLSSVAGASPVGSALTGLASNRQFVDALGRQFAPTPSFDMYSNPANVGLMSAFGNNTAGVWDDSSYYSNPNRRGM